VAAGRSFQNKAFVGLPGPTKQDNPERGGTMTTNGTNGPGPVELSPLLTVREVAGLLGIHVRTVWRLAALAEMGEGRFPRPVRIAKKTVRWRREDVAGYLKALAAEASR